MLTVSGFGVLAAIFSIGLSLACYVGALAYGRVVVRHAQTTTVHAGGGGAGGDRSAVGVIERSGAPDERGSWLPDALAAYATIVAWLALSFLTLALVARTIATGHAPFANMYEFSLAFAWGIVGTYLYFETRYHARAVGLVALPIAFLLVAYATTLPSTASPLVPALQNSLLLTVHVATAIVAYGTFAVAFAAAALRLVRPLVVQGLPNADLLDEIAYRAVVVGFPFLTLTIALGAVWADIAWGSYWSWDPKETASLVTWFIYGAYLHARVIRGWEGGRAAWLLVAGFAAIGFTFFGNLFLGGQHSYAGV